MLHFKYARLTLAIHRHPQPKPKPTAMEDKRNEQRKQWASSHPEVQATRSMKRRKAGHDYKGRCIYMITLAIEGRQPLLGTLCGKDATHDFCWIKTSKLGDEIKMEWKKIPEHYPQIRPLALQLMPDHLHGVLFVTEPLPRHLGHVINGFKKGTHYHQQHLGMGLPRSHLAWQGTARHDVQVS